MTDIAAAFTDAALVPDARDVLATLAPREREVRRAEDDRWYIRCTRPYRSMGDVIEGVVITLVDVTQLKRAQERVAALAAIVESAQDGILGVGLDGTITTWNPGAERIYGYAASEAVGLPLAALHRPEARAALEQERARAARGEHVEVENVAAVHKDGHGIDVFLSLSPVRDAAGGVVALSAIAHDVTERLRAERERRRGESRLRGLSRSDVISIAFLDQEGLIADANDALLGMLGYGRDNLARGAVLLDRLVPPESRDQVRALVREMWGEGQCAPQEVECLRRDGSRFACLLGGARLEGGAEGVVFLVDVTGRQRAVAELRRSEERLRLAVDATMLGTWKLDVVSGAMSCSPRTLDLWGFAPGEEVNYPTRLARIYPDDRPAVDEAVRRALDPGGPGEYRIAYRVPRPDGGWRWVESSGRVFFDDAGGFRRPVRLFVTVLDVTERKRTEEALQEAGRRKDQFLAMLGHELRNPLAPIRNAAQVLRKVGGGDPVLARARDIIDRQVRHMTHLLDDLLDVSRVAAGKISLRKERMDLVELVRATVEEHRPDAQAGGLALAASLPDRPVWVFADPTRISQSVANLLINALKFTPAGGHVAVAVAPEPGGTAAVTVSDDGMGIEPEMLDRLFEPFAQADRSLDRSRGGLGLGLSLVRSFVEMHGGAVAVRSEGPGKGSAFTLRLPLAEAPPAEMPEPAAPARPQRVLVIEDNMDAAETMATMLELYGHEVAVAHTGPEGVERARSFGPTVVLCDIGLPGGMDGYAVARALRAEPALREARLVALTGYGQDDDKLRAREAGFDEHLTKPVNLAGDRACARGARRVAAASAGDALTGGAIVGRRPDSPPPPDAGLGPT